jgi:hypothetical protein
VRAPRRQLLSAFLVLPVALAACGGGTAATAGVTPTATASIQIIGTPAPALGSTASTTAAATTSGALTVSTVASATTAVNTSVTSTATGAVYTVTGTGNVGLRLRQTPNGNKITDLPAGSNVTAVGDPTQQAGGLTWVHVKSAKGDVGWVASQYLAGLPAAATATTASATATTASSTGTPVPGGQQ